MSVSRPWTRGVESPSRLAIHAWRAQRAIVALLVNLERQGVELGAQEEIAAAVAAAVTESGATGPQDMGKIMAILKPKLAGQADMAAVSLLVKAQLAGR